MMKIIICSILILLSFQSIFGQQTFVGLRYFPENNGVIVHWIPGNDSIFEVGLKNGYLLIRQDLETNEYKVIGDSIFPRSVDWFSENKNQESGMIGALGNLLYDNSKVNEDWAIRENRNIRYRYISTEARYSERIAVILGLGILDTSCIQGRKYRYELFLKDPVNRLILGSRDYLFSNLETIDSLDVDPLLDISPPDGIPLSMMRNDFGKFNQIHLLAKAHVDSVVLRWVPNNLTFWLNSNIFGYRLLRREIVIDSSYIPENDGYTLLDTIKPWTEEQFAAMYQGLDSMVLVAAQCLYGKTVTGPSDGFYMQSSEEEMKYGFALFAADNSPDAANSLGLRYVDKNVQPGRYYSYHVLSNASSSFYESAFVEIRNIEEVSAEKVKEVTIDSLEHAVRIQWPRSNDSRFSAYKIERSENGGREYFPITSAPLVFIDNPNVEEGPLHSFVDSLSLNYKPFHYRIQGIDPFGEWSSPVEVIGMGIDLTPPAAPVLLVARSTLEGTINLKWDIPEQADDLAFFHVLLSDQHLGEYKPIAEKLPLNQKEYTFPGPLNTNRSYHFKIAAEDDKGNVSRSGSYYVHLVDSIPPEAPNNLGFRTDSTGVVSLFWDHGKEVDLIGYRVYFANNPDHEFSQITSSPTEFNAWFDTITLNALDKEVYYRVVAEDRSHNLSPFSDILTVRRFDIVPPAAPVFLPVSSDMNGIRLRWSPSPSNDLAGYILYRRLPESDTAFTSIAFLDSSQVAHTDSTAIADVLYEYTLQAMDKSGLFSTNCISVKAIRMFDLSSLKVDQLKVILNEKDSTVQLNWVYVLNNEPGITNPSFLIYLYKKIEPGGWMKIKQFNSNVSEYKDADINQSGRYAYAVKVVRSDGKSGVLTESGWIEVAEQKK